MKRTLALLVLVASYCANTAVAQTESLWREISATSEIAAIVPHRGVARLSFPTDFKLFDLDIKPLRQELFSVVSGYGLKYSTIISLPNADGQLEQYEVFEASNFEPDLQVRFPEIRAFSGRGITDRYATLKMSISPEGLQTMVFRTDRENEFIEVYSGDNRIYAVFRSQRRTGQLPWTCSTEDNRVFEDLNGEINSFHGPESSTGQLKTMRLAQSCNGEYANYFGATSSAQVGLVLAAFNATLTRCNGVFERDLALHLNLIAATTNVIYYNPTTDPYTSMSNWNSQLQSTLTSIIGEANYDIGHMFGASGGGGNAGCIGCVCVNGQKGSGITSPADGIPQGDNFDIDYVAHEIGHQLGANHTYSFQNEGTSVQKEVGAGITIMGYAGITSWDPAPHSIDIFHQASIAQIQTNLAGKSCPVTTNITTNNATPVVAPVSNHTIPISTPFALTGSATDANPGDALTYCWEQNDNKTTTGNNSVASPTKATGPNWISFSPTASPTRYFPRLSTILAGLYVTPTLGGDAICNVEALSSVARTLNFRLTVRDNSPYSSTPPVKVGQTQYTDMTVTVNNTAGPFAVTAPNTAVSWIGGSTQTVTWSVANTTASPISCANVKISLSTDGGQTFPTVLAASTPNDGSEALTIPNTPTTTARIKVEAVGNIFFDISNASFTITASTLAAPTLVFPSDNATQQPVSLTLLWNAVATATSYRLQVGTDSTFASGLVVHDSTLTDTTRLVSGISTGTKYFWRVQAKNGSATGSWSSLRRFTTIAPPPAVTLVAPLSNATEQNTTLNILWRAAAQAAVYRLQVATDSLFVGGLVIDDSTLTDTSFSASGLLTSTAYFWRVRGSNVAGDGSWSVVRKFTTVTPPGTAALLFPPNNATGILQTVELVWNTIPRAVEYKLQMATDSAFATGIVIDDSTTTDTSFVVSGLSYSEHYFWRVRGANIAGEGAPSPVRRFSTLFPAAVVSLASPQDGSTDQPVSLGLHWEQAEGASVFFVQLSTDSMFAGGMVVDDSTLTDTLRAVNGLESETTYFWRVMASNPAGDGGWSTPWRFTTASMPAPVVLLSPLPGTEVPSDTVEVTWENVTGVDAYWLEWSEDSLFAVSFVDSTLIDTAAVIRDLADSTTYYWRVRAGNGAGWGPFGETRPLATLFKIQVCIPLLDRWNLVSVPVGTYEDSVHVLFPDCGSQPAYSYSSGSGYSGSLTMQAGRGYWVKCTSGSVCMTGTSVSRDTILVQTGWNLIGTISEGVPTSAIATIPPGIVESPFYVFHNGYQQSGTLEPGRAYWVKVRQSGAIVLESTAVGVAKPATGKQR